MTDQSHNADLNVVATAQSHGADINVSPIVNREYVRMQGLILFPIGPSDMLKLGATMAAPAHDFVQLAATIRAADNRDAVKLGGLLKSVGNEYVRLGGTVMLGGVPTHSADLMIAFQTLEFLRLGGTINTTIKQGPCGSFPDSSYVKLGGWIVSAVPGQTSKQMPGTDYEDFLSSDVALSAYRQVSRFVLNGLGLIVTAFSAGVVSFQTRTRQWLRRVDAAPSGIVISTETQTRTLPTGEVITTTTERKLLKDIEATTVTTKTNRSPGRTTVQVIERSKTGKEVNREIKTNTSSGITHTVEKKTVTTSPPTKDNIQPIKVRTLDGFEHFQWFDAVNPEFSGGDQEGTTVTDHREQVIPSELNGQTVDAFGHPILALVVDETSSRPDGSVTETHTETIGVQNRGGTEVTDSESSFDGDKVISKSTTTHPDGSKTIVESTKDAQSGVSVEVTTDVATDEVGRQTTTTTTVERTTFFDAAQQKNRTTEKRTVTVVQNNEVQSSEVTEVTRDDFEDDIINRKIKVYLVQEFTITCIMDWQTKDALLETQIAHQKGFALLELFGQQLGNANLSWELRQRLIQQFEEANSCIAPVKLEALGKTYDVVFAPSASAFRAKYITGTEPHVYEVQLILQQRSDLITGTKGF